MIVNSIAISKKKATTRGNHTIRLSVQNAWKEKVILYDKNISSVKYFFVCSSIFQEKASEAEDELDTLFEYLYKEF